LGRGKPINGTNKPFVSNFGIYYKDKRSVLEGMSQPPHIFVYGDDLKNRPASSPPFIKTFSNGLLKVNFQKQEKRT